MDERIKGEYRKIYSELFSIIMVMAVVSFLIKILYFEYGLENCIFEYIIMVGSPVYLAIRCSMLNVVSINPKKMSVKYNVMICVVFAVIMIIAAYLKGVSDYGEIFTAVVSFIAVYLAVRYLFVYIYKKRQEKIDSKYED